MTVSRLGGKRILCRLGKCAFLLTVGALMSSCTVGAVVGGMVESYKRDSTHAVEAEYEGLRGKTFAVVVAAPRSVQSEYPEILPLLTRNIVQRLRESCEASGYVPAERVLQFQYKNPRWVAMHPAELAEELGGVERLVYVDIEEYTLTEPGNPYVWSGIASGMVGVIESDSVLPDDFAFIKHVSVTFPNETGLGPLEISTELMHLGLAKRFVDRTTWIFYEHQEPYYPEY